MRRIGTKVSGSSWSESEKQAVWNKGTHVTGESPSLWRKDRYGALIYRHYHGDTSKSHGWEIDHITPVSKGGTDALSNLQPLQWNNNRRKGDS